MDREDGSSDNIYVNIDAIRGKAGKNTTDSTTIRTPSSELTGSECVKIRCYRAATVCLVLLCVLLLTAVIVLCVLIHTNNHQIHNLTEERNQLLTNNTNLTEERDKLLTNNTNLTEERDQLLTNNTNLTEKRNQLLTTIHDLNKQDGWIYKQSSFYFFSSEKKNWSESRRYCREREADLVIINNTEEQDFVKNISGEEAVWIGLTDSDVEGSWKWVDGSTLTSSYRSFWKPGEPNSFKEEEDCVVSTSTGFNDFPCYYLCQWICEKRFVQLLK